MLPLHSARLEWGMKKEKSCHEIYRILLFSAQTYS